MEIIDIVYVFTNPSWNGIKICNKRNFGVIDNFSEDIFITDMNSISRVEWDNNINTYDNKIVNINTSKGICKSITYMVDYKKFDEIINNIVYSKNKDYIVIDIRKDNKKLIKK